MLLTKKDIQDFRDEDNLTLSCEQETAIHNRFGMEPDDCIW